MPSINIESSSPLYSKPIVTNKLGNSLIKNILYFVMGGLFIGIGIWIINGLFENNPFYDGTRLWYIIPGFMYLRPILMIIFGVTTIIFFWKRQRPFAIGALTLSIIALLGYMGLTWLYFGNPFSSSF